MKVCEEDKLKVKDFFRGPTERMNPDFADSAPKVADLADIWPYFGADKTGGFPLKIRHSLAGTPVFGYLSPWDP